MHDVTPVMRARFVCVALSGLLLAACGGGGGGGGNGGTPMTPRTQTIAFAQAGPLTALVGASIDNPATGGAGTGAVSYRSSDDTVAVVDGSGVVTLMAAGSADITATKAADASHLEAEASYTVEVSETARAAAWVSTGSGAAFTFPSLADGATFARSNDPDCDPANIGACSNGQSDIVSGMPVTDTTLGLASTGYHFLQSGGRTSRRDVASVDRFSPRIGHGAVRFDGRYWVIAGGQRRDGVDLLNGDVWSSEDGRTWDLVQPNAAFGNRWFYQTVVFDGRIWVIGNDVWSSTDGESWTLVSAGTPFADVLDLNVVPFQGALWGVYRGTAYRSTDGVTWQAQSASGATGGDRQHATLTVFDGALWLVAGNDPTLGPDGTTLADVWRSANGIDWAEVQPAAFPERAQHVSFELDGRLWVVGGISQVGAGTSAANADAWSTTDGVTWTEETGLDELDRLYFGRAVSDGDSVALIGGIQIGYANQVWWSSDGDGWNVRSPHAGFSPRYGSDVVAFDGALWLVGGTDQLGGARNDVWRSTDGVDWSRVEPQGPRFDPLSSHRLVVFNDRLWVIGGLDGSTATGGTGTARSEVWSSADGATWTEHVPAGGTFTPRYAHEVAVFANRLWLIGGQSSSGTPLGDVWSSGNGTDWTQESPAAAFGPRTAHEVVAFAGALWLFGGNDGTTTYGDVWTSGDGVDWSEVTAAGASYPARLGHAVTVHDGAMWLAGGTDSSDYETGIAFNDVWSTVDGASWTERTPAAAFAPRWTHRLVSFEDRLWLLTGLDRTVFDDVWRSSDGSDWRVGYTTTFSFD